MLRFGILPKIWFSLSILVVGYFISMTLGFILGRQTESRLYNVSECLFPAATHSRLALTAFNEQIKLYQDVIMLGEETILELTLAKSDKAQEALLTISNLQGLEPERVTEVLEDVKLLKQFTKEAQQTYAAIGILSKKNTLEMKFGFEKPSESSLKNLAEQTDRLRSSFTYFAEMFALELKTELSAIRLVTRQQRYLNMIVFFIVVISTLSLVSIIIGRTISRPLRKTLMLEKAVEQTGDGIAVTDLDGALQFINNAWANMHGYEAIELIGKHMDCFHTEDQLEKEVKPFFEMVIANGSYNQEIWHKRKDESVFPSMLTGNLLTDSSEKVVSMVYLARDITERKQAEKALEKSLEDLKSAQAQLVQSEKMAALGGLVAGVAHEINTPLGVGITAASFLEEKTRKASENYNAEKLRRSDLEKYMRDAIESSAMILSNLNRAADLVRSFKLVAVDQSSMERRKFNMKEYIDEMLFSIRPRYKRTKHAITVNCPDNIELDSYPGAFSQIITNLVMNSLIHGFDKIEAGKIEFNIWEEEQSLVFCYSDDGKGMDQKTLEKSFDPFFTTNRSHGGTGLGMHILYNLTTQTLGGQIEYTSTPDHGIVLFIKVPLQAPKTKDGKNEILI